MPQGLYNLAGDVYWRTVNGLCVFLDVESDRYLSVPADKFVALLPFLGSHSTDPGSDCAREMSSELSAFAEELLAERLLTRGRSNDTRPRSLNLPKPVKLLTTEEHTIPLLDAVQLFPWFIRACVRADYSLRRSTLSRICSRVRRRKLRTTVDSSAPMISLTHSFHIFRPFYPRSYLCLFDSLALLEYLAHWKVFPEWVFGVSVDPFEAHCWVQSNELVISDTITFSSRWYSAIMAI